MLPLVLLPSLLFLISNNLRITPTLYVNGHLFVGNVGSLMLAAVPFGSTVLSFRLVNIIREAYLLALR